MAVILKILIFVTYLLSRNKGCSQNGQYIVELIISYKGWRLVQLSDRYITEYTKLIIEIPIAMTYLFMVMKFLSLHDEYIMKMIK